MNGTDPTGFDDKSCPQGQTCGGGGGGGGSSFISWGTGWTIIPMNSTPSTTTTTTSTTGFIDEDGSLVVKTTTTITTVGGTGNATQGQTGASALDIAAAANAEAVANLATNNAAAANPAAGTIAGAVLNTGTAGNGSGALSAAAPPAGTTSSLTMDPVNQAILGVDGVSDDGVAQVHITGSVPSSGMSPAEQQLTIMAAPAAAGAVLALGSAAYVYSTAQYGTLKTWQSIFGFVRALNKFTGPAVEPAPPPTPPSMSTSGLRQYINDGKLLRDGNLIDKTEPQFFPE